MGFVTRMSVLILIYFLRLSMKQAAAETASARLTPSVSFADRPSAFRFPVSRTAGGKLHALKEGAFFGFFPFMQ